MDIVVIGSSSSGFETLLSKLIATEKQKKCNKFDLSFIKKHCQHCELFNNYMVSSVPSQGSPIVRDSSMPRYLKFNIGSSNCNSTCRVLAYPGYASFVQDCMLLQKKKATRFSNICVLMVIDATTIVREYATLRANSVIREQLFFAYCLGFSNFCFAINKFDHESISFKAHSIYELISQELDMMLKLMRFPAIKYEIVPISAKCDWNIFFNPSKQQASMINMKDRYAQKNLSQAILSLADTYKYQSIHQNGCSFKALVLNIYNIGGVNGPVLHVKILSGVLACGVKFRKNGDRSNIFTVKSIETSHGETTFYAGDMTAFSILESNKTHRNMFSEGDLLIGTGDPDFQESIHLCATLMCTDNTNNSISITSDDDPPQYNLTPLTYPAMHYRCIVRKLFHRFNRRNGTLLNVNQISNPSSSLLPGQVALVHLEIIPSHSSMYILPELGILALSDKNQKNVGNCKIVGNLNDMSNNPLHDFFARVTIDPITAFHFLSKPFSQSLIPYSDVSILMSE